LKPRRIQSTTGDRKAAERGTGLGAGCFGSPWNTKRFSIARQGFYSLGTIHVGTDAQGLGSADR
jgi:hypothetical protein